MTVIVALEASLKAGSHFIDRKMPRVITDPRVLHSVPELQTAKLSPKITCQCHAQTAKSKPEPNLSCLKVLTLPCNITECLALWLVDLLQVCSDLTERAISKQWQSTTTFFSFLGQPGLTTRWQDKVKQCIHKRKHSWAYFLPSTNVFQMSQLLFVSNCLKHGSVPSNNKLLVFNL